MKQNKLSVAIFKSCLEEKGFRVEFFYDRMKLYIDSSNDTTKIEELYPKAGEQTIIPRVLSHYDTMNSMVDVLQPDEEYLKNLQQAITGDYVINYVEFSMDIMSEDENKIKQLRQLFNKFLVYERKIKAGRFYYATGEVKVEVKGEVKVKGENTYYFGNRTDHKDILVVYSDKRSKVDKSYYCVHIEMRLIGSKILKRNKIYTVADLIDYNHDDFWNKHLDLRDVSRNQLGRLCHPDQQGMNDSSYSRKGQTIVSHYKSSQELLLKNPEAIKAFYQIEDRRMFKARLDKALS